RLESALQVKRALAELLAQFRQRQRFVQVLLDVAANRLYLLLPRISSQRPGTASQALAKSRALGFLRTREEAHVLAPRPLGRTRRPAIHSRRRHGKHKLAVACFIARKHRIPA